MKCLIKSGLSRYLMLKNRVRVVASDVAFVYCMHNSLLRILLDVFFQFIYRVKELGGVGEGSGKIIPHFYF